MDNKIKMNLINGLSEEFVNDLNKLDLNENQLDYICKKYQTFMPSCQNITSITESIAKNFNGTLDTQLCDLSLDVFDYKADEINFNKDLILSLLKECKNEECVKLFLNKAVITEIDDANIEVYLFDENNKRVFNKYNFFETTRMESAIDSAYMANH